MKKIVILLLAATAVASGQPGVGTSSGPNIGGGTAASAQSTSTRVVYASKLGARLDSDVYNGGGTDDSTALQSALNLASLKGFELVIDGPALISTNLVLRSNTKLRFLPGAGLFMAPHANCWVLGNQQNTNYSSTNIVIEGGILNCNGIAQAEYVTNGFRLSGAPGVWGVWFAGVDGVIMRDTTIVNSKTYALLFSDSRNGLFENITCMWTNNMAATNTFYGTDCVHSQGNVTNLHVNGLMNIRGNDDTFALMTDETDFTLPVNDPRWTINSGSMKDILIENVTLEKGWDGVYPRNIGKFECQSSTNARLENITIRNVHGQVISQGLVALVSGVATTLSMKNVLIDGFYINFPTSYDVAGTTPMALGRISCDTLTIKNVVINDNLGIGLGQSWISVGARTTNVFLSNIYMRGSAGSVNNGDVGVYMFADPSQDSVFDTNSPNISIVNMTTKSLASVIGGDSANGVVRMDNIQRIATPVVSSGTFTNIYIGEPVTSTATLTSGVWFTNQSGRLQEVRQMFTITEAAVAGTAKVHLITGQQGAALGTWITNASFGQQTIATSLVSTNVGQLAWGVSNSLVYCFTNEIIGSGNSITPRPNSSQVITY